MAHDQIDTGAIVALVDLAELLGIDGALLGTYARYQRGELTTRRDLDDFKDMIASLMNVASEFVDQLNEESEAKPESIPTATIGIAKKVIRRG